VLVGFNPGLALLGSALDDMEDWTAVELPPEEEMEFPEVVVAGAVECGPAGVGRRAGLK